MHFNLDNVSGMYYSIDVQIKFPWYFPKKKESKEFDNIINIR